MTRRTGPDPETVITLLTRCAGCCEVCGKPLSGRRGYAWSVHHRRGRDGKPDSHQPQNLLVVCGADNSTGCHGRIHQHAKTESEPNGWWISRIAVANDPLTIPVLVGHGSRWVYLTATGEYADNPPEVTR